MLLTIRFVSSGDVLSWIGSLYDVSNTLHDDLNSGRFSIVAWFILEKLFADGLCHYLMCRRSCIGKNFRLKLLQCRQSLYLLNSVVSGHFSIVGISFLVVFGCFSQRKTICCCCGVENLYPYLSVEYPSWYKNFLLIHIL